MDYSIFKKATSEMQEKFVENYKGETDIEKILNMSHLKDNLDALIEEMIRQPSIYAYWANLKRMAEENLTKYESKLEGYKASRLSKITEHIKSAGVSHSSVKLIDAKFYELYGKEELCGKYIAAIEKWSERRNVLSIIVKAIEGRNDTFRSLSYLVSHMMSSGIYVPNKKRTSLKPVPIKEGE